MAKRHRGIKDEQGIKIWIEMLELNHPKTLLSRLGRMLDVIVEDRWWIDRDALRAKLPISTDHRLYHEVIGCDIRKKYTISMFRPM